MSKVISALIALRRYFTRNENAPLFTLVCSVKDSRIYSLSKRFENIEENVNFAIATFVDPRYKQMFF